MEKLDLLLIIMRAVAMSFFIIEALHLLIYSGKYRFYRMFGVTQLLMGGIFLLTIISNYFSDTSFLYGGHLILLWNLTVPAIIVMLYELLKARRTRKRYIISNFLPFILFFLVYSVNNNQEFLGVVKYLTLGYATVSVIVLQVMMLKEIGHHEVVSEKHAYMWFAVVMWTMYASLFIRILLAYIDVHLAKIITMVVLIAVFAIVNYLLRHGLLDFHSLQRVEQVDDFWEDYVPAAVPAVNIPADENKAVNKVPNRSAEQSFFIQEQILYYGDKARQLNELMETKRLYLNPDLTATMVSTELGTNRTYLSNLLNQYLRTTFSNYVNAFRVKYAKNLLLKTDDTIEDIFQVSGFQSRTTFWRAFAQIEGCTPKEFRRRAAQNYLSSLKSLKELSENNL